jgi:hypothetical protein
MFVTKCVIVHFYMYCFVFTCCAIDIPGYFKWSLKGREKVFCPETCRTEDSPDMCCSCEAKPCWELNPTLCPIWKLSVEY